MLGVHPGPERPDETSGSQPWQGRGPAADASCQDARGGDHGRNLPAAPVPEPAGPDPRGARLPCGNQELPSTSSKHSIKPINAYTHVPSHVRCLKKNQSPHETPKARVLPPEPARTTARPELSVCTSQNGTHTSRPAPSGNAAPVDPGNKGDKACRHGAAARLIVDNDGAIDATSSRDIFVDIQRDPCVLVAALGAVARRKGQWTFVDDLELVFHHWKYLLNPRVYELRTRTISGRLCRRRVDRLRLDPATRRLFPKKAPASLEAFRPHVDAILGLFRGGRGGATSADAVPAMLQETWPATGAPCPDSAPTTGNQRKNQPRAQPEDVPGEPCPCHRAVTWPALVGAPETPFARVPTARNVVEPQRAKPAPTPLVPWMAPTPTACPAPERAGLAGIAVSAAVVHRQTGRRGIVERLLPDYRVAVRWDLPVWDPDARTEPCPLTDLRREPRGIQQPPSRGPDPQRGACQTGGTILHAGLDDGATSRQLRVTAREKVCAYAWLLPSPGMAPLRLSYDDDCDLRAPHGDLPPNASINFYRGTARVPEAWHYTMISDQILAGVPLAPMSHTILDVTRSTTIGHILGGASAAFLKYTRMFNDATYQAACRRPAERRAALEALAATPWHLALPGADGTYVLVDLAATVEAVDLFHRRDDVLIVTAAMDGVGAANRYAAAAPYNVAPRTAPGHIETLSRVYDSWGNYSEGSHLKDLERKPALRALLEAYPSVPFRVCYNCGILMYQPGNSRYTARHIRTRQDCRAWRVYEQLIVEHGEKMHRVNGMDPADVFLCDPVPDGSGCKVYTCGPCKSAKQCNPAEFDLFDGQSVPPGGQPVDWGLGRATPHELQELDRHDRQSLATLKMNDATFQGYSGATYSRFAGAGTLTDQDFHGAAALLLGPAPPPDSTSRRDRRRVALEYLQGCNPHVRSCLTAYERATRNAADDAFPTATGGASGMAVVDESSLDAYGGDDGDGATREQSPAGGRISGVAAPFSELPAHVHDACAAAPTTVGSVRKRARPADNVVCDNKSYENQLHTCLYYLGGGGWQQTDIGCTAQRHAKVRLLSVNDKFRRSEEVIYDKYIAGVKRAFHAGGCRVAPGHVVQAPRRRIVAELRRNLAANRTAPDAACDPFHSFTGAVGPTVVGSRRYWHEAFLELMALAVTHGLPQYFATFTANEAGWADMRQACDSPFASDRPVEATEHYHFRWQQFKDKYLKDGTRSPIGTIERTWWRHEDQQRGALHVHMALWVGGDSDPTKIRGTAPRPTPDATGAVSPVEAQWRKFVLHTQTHRCRPACYFKKGIQLDACKSGYPRPLRDALYKNTETERYEYPAFEEEDQRLSPYVTEWLLAWGANINVQYCTTTAFLSYIAKYVTKPEPHGIARDTDELRDRENMSGQQRYLAARFVRAPEVVTRVLGRQLHSKVGAVRLCTDPPGVRFRTKAQRRTVKDIESGESPWADGTIERYAQRPRDVQYDGDGAAVDFENMVYEDFWQEYDVLPYDKVSQTALNGGLAWRCDGQPPPPADGPGAKDRYTVRRQERAPVIYRWRLPHLHGQDFYYQLLLLRTSWRNDPNPSEMILDRLANPNGNLREECILRGLLEDGDDAELVRQEAERRRFSPEAVERMAQDVEDFADVMDFTNAAFPTEHDWNLDGTAGTSNDPELLSLAQELERRRPRPARPDVRETGDGRATWLPPDATAPVTLTCGQYHAYTLLREAGNKQLFAFLSGEAGMGKSMLVRLLVQDLRSRGYNVIISGSSGLAARNIGGHTVHEAFKLGKLGRFDPTRLKPKSEHWAWVAFNDVIIIDEISMLAATALRGVNETTTYVATKGATRHAIRRAFGGQSVIVIGDLYQLPAVEKRREDQVWQSMDWPMFHFVELTENCRHRGEDAWALCLSHLRVRARDRPDSFTDADRELLMSRLCRNHGGTETFVDYVPESRGCNATSSECTHCHIAPNATVLAAKREKVGQLNRRHMESLGDTVRRATVFAKDIRLAHSAAPCGDVQAAISEELTRKLSGFPPVLELYEGMRAILTVNKDQQRGFVNGSFGEVVGWTEDTAGQVVAIIFRVDATGNTVTVRRQNSYMESIHGLRVVRHTFPMVPAHAVTVHRVQGATIPTDLHILLNREFFAAGQAYVALGRTNRPDQIHLWDLDFEAMYADPDIVRQYDLLRRHPLTRAVVDTAETRVRTTLMPLDTCWRTW